MEINSKIHVEQTAPPGIHRQHSDKRDGQTDRQKNSTFLAAPAAGELNPSPTDLGTVTEDLEHVLVPLKLFGVRHIVSPLRGAENLAETQHHQLKTPITP